MLAVFGFPDDLETTFGKIIPATMTAVSFDGIVDDALAVDHFKGFPNDDGHFRYCTVIDGFSTNAQLKPQGNRENAARKVLLVEFGPLYRLERFVNEFNAAARIYRTPEHRAALKKLAGLVDFVKSHDDLTKIDPEKTMTLVQEAKELKSEINYKIFNDLPVSNGCIDKIKTFLNDLTEKEITKMGDLGTVARQIYLCDIWQQMYRTAKDGRPTYEKANLLDDKTFNEKWEDISNDVKFYLVFLQK